MGKCRRVGYVGRFIIPIPEFQIIENINILKTA